VSGELQPAVLVTKESGHAGLPVISIAGLIGQDNAMVLKKRSLCARSAHAVSTWQVLIDDSNDGTDILSLFSKTLKIK